MWELGGAYGLIGELCPLETKRKNTKLMILEGCIPLQKSNKGLHATTLHMGQPVMLALLLIAF